MSSATFTVGSLRRVVEHVRHDAAEATRLVERKIDPTAAWHGREAVGHLEALADLLAHLEEGEDR